MNIWLFVFAWICHSMSVLLVLCSYICITKLYKFVYKRNTSKQYDQDYEMTEFEMKLQRQTFHERYIIGFMEWMLEHYPSKRIQIIQCRENRENRENRSSKVGLGLTNIDDLMCMYDYRKHSNRMKQFYRRHNIDSREARHIYMMNCILTQLRYLSFVGSIMLFNEYEKSYRFIPKENIIRWIENIISTEKEEQIDYLGDLPNTIIIFTEFTSCSCGHTNVFNEISHKLRSGELPNSNIVNNKRMVYLYSNNTTNYTYNADTSTIREFRSNVSANVRTRCDYKCSIESNKIFTRKRTREIIRKLHRETSGDSWTSSGDNWTSSGDNWTPSDIEFVLKNGIYCSTKYVQSIYRMNGFFAVSPDEKYYSVYKISLNYTDS